MNTRTWLLADMGGTHTRCALLPPSGRLAGTKVFANRDFAGPIELFRDFLDGIPDESRPTSALLAVAAPVTGQQLRMVNLDWEIDSKALARAFGWARVQLMNDFAALAHALPALETEDLAPVGGGRPVAGAARVVLGPGTGLGTAALLEADGRCIALAGEGGHTTLPAATEEEARVIAFARALHGHCSAERLVSGPGLSLLHEALHGQAGVAPAQIAARADAGDAEAAASLEMLFQLLGTVASNLALVFDARGGVYIGGGIVPRHLERFAASGFRKRFSDKGRYRQRLEEIPTCVITAAQPALVGLARYARQQASG